MPVLNKSLVILLLSGSVAFAQATANTSCSEYFASATPTGQWTISNPGTDTTRWYTAGEIPGMHLLSDNATGGYAYFPCAVGTQDFTFQFDAYLQNAWGGDFFASGVAIALGTAPPNSLSSTDVQVVVKLNTTPGPYMGMWLGNMPAAFNTPVSNDISGGALITSNNVNGTWKYPILTSTQTFSAPAQRYTFKYVKTGNNITFNGYVDNYQNGLVPYFTYSFAIPSTPTNYQTKSYQYVSLMTTRSTQSVAKNESQVQFTNIRVQAGITGTPPTITNVAPSASGGVLSSGSGATITGTGFDCGGEAYTVQIGDGSNLSIVTPTCVSATSMTVTLPTLGATGTGRPYIFHVLRGGVDSEYYPGISYSAAVLTSILPFEVPPTPANAADATVNFTGTGFDPTCAVTFAGVSGTVTYNTPTSLSVIVPAGSLGAPRIILTCAVGTVYDSNTSGTYPASGKLNFGYASHPYLQFNSASLPAIQANWTNPAYADYVASINLYKSSTLTTSNPQRYMGYGYASVLGGSLADQAEFWSEFTSIDDVNMIDFYSRIPSYPATLGNYVLHVAQFYDTFFPTLTPTQRAQLEQFLVRAVAYFRYAKLEDTNGAGSGSGSTGKWPNRIVICQVGGGYALLSLYFSLQSFRDLTGDANAYVSELPETDLAAIDTQLISWANYSWVADGYVEGPQYTTYGTFPFLTFARGRINVNTLRGQSPADPGFFATNYQAVNAFMDLSWDGVTPWTSVNDTEPLDYAIPLLIDGGQRYTNALNASALADYLLHLEQNTIPGSTIIGSSGWRATRDYNYGLPYGLMWRSSAPNGTNKVTLSRVVIAPALQQAVLRSQTTITPDFELSIKGKGNHEESSSTAQHGFNHLDQGTFTLTSRMERFLVDPGYYYDAANQHSGLSIGGIYPTANVARITTFDSTAAINTGAWTVVAHVITSAYASGVTLARRNYVMYANGAARFAIVLDDVNPSGSATVVENLQVGPVVSSLTSGGFTMTAQRSAVKVSWNGPTVTQGSSTQTYCGGNAAFLYYCLMPQIPAVFTTVTGTYTADVTNPLLTMFAPASLAGTGGLTALVDRSIPGVVVVTLSDGSSITFGNGSGAWKVTATYTNGVVAQ